MSFVWFWTFWHWSKESFRNGAVLRSPLQGIGGHWDEWFRHEASGSELAAIAKAGQTEGGQRRFIGWLLLHWAPEANLCGNALTRYFVLNQLAQVQPFSQWAAFGRYRDGYGTAGVSAVVLTEGSAGEPEDVRPIEALILPADTTAPAVVAEGFQAERTELETPRRAAMSLLRGKGLMVLLGLWLAGGQRPYPRWLKAMLAAAWVAVGGLIIYLLAGPEPGGRLKMFGATLAGLWIALVLVALGMAAAQGFLAWRLGRKWRAKLEESQVRLRMNGGLTLMGGSAGLPFCLNMLLALHRAEPRSARRSWLWQQLFQKLRAGSDGWAATGVITAEGQLKPVVLEPKLRACLQREGTDDILTPRQPGASWQAVSRLAQALLPKQREAIAAIPRQGKVRLGFAAERRSLRAHACRHLAQALMRLGELNSRSQMALNVFAIGVSIVMLFALHDLRGIVLPPPAPMATAPTSPLPDYLWVSLDTKNPEDFLVVLESDYWSNRRVEVSPHTGANGSMRAEIQLRRAPAPGDENKTDGIVWVERRHRFLTRDFAPGERVGRYDLSYIHHLGYE